MARKTVLGTRGCATPQQPVPCLDLNALGGTRVFVGPPGATVIIPTPNGEELVLLAANASQDHVEWAAHQVGLGHRVHANLGRVIEDAVAKGIERGLRSGERG